jgi:ABC-type Mn2+/Zn2+ transport system permease subunit
MLEQWWLLIPGLAAVIICVAVVRRGPSRIDRAVATALLGGLAASLLVNDSPGPVMIGGLATVLAIEGGICHRALTLPVLRLLAPPVAAALPQEP